MDQVIYRRKPALDQLREGLSLLNFIELVRHFPLTFEAVFLASAADSKPTPSSLRRMLIASETDRQCPTYELLLQFISSLDEEGIKYNPPIPA